MTWIIFYRKNLNRFIVKVVYSKGVCQVPLLRLISQKLNRFSNKLSMNLSKKSFIFSRRRMKSYENHLKKIIAILILADIKITYYKFVNTSFYQTVCKRRLSEIWHDCPVLFTPGLQLNTKFLNNNSKVKWMFSVLNIK